MSTQIEKALEQSTEALERVNVVLKENAFLKEQLKEALQDKAHAETHAAFGKKILTSLQASMKDVADGEWVNRKIEVSMKVQMKQGQMLLGDLRVKQSEKSSIIHPVPPLHSS